jgi:hypothetical protein
MQYNLLTIPGLTTQPRIKMVYLEVIWLALLAETGELFILQLPRDLLSI